MIFSRTEASACIFSRTEVEKIEVFVQQKHNSIPIFSLLCTFPTELKCC